MGAALNRLVCVTEFCLDDVLLTAEAAATKHLVYQKILGWFFESQGLEFLKETFCVPYSELLNILLWNLLCESAVLGCMLCEMLGFFQKSSGRVTRQAQVISCLHLNIILS